MIRGSLSKGGAGGREGLLWDLEEWDLGHVVRHWRGRGLHARVRQMRASRKISETREGSR